MAYLVMTSYPHPRRRKLFIKMSLLTDTSPEGWTQSNGTVNGIYVTNGTNRFCFPRAVTDIITLIGSTCIIIVCIQQHFYVSCDAAVSAMVGSAMAITITCAACRHNACHCPQRLSRSHPVSPSGVSRHGAAAHVRHTNTYLAQWFGNDTSQGVSCRESDSLLVPI